METLLRQKLGLLQEMLAMTQAERFTGTHALLEEEAARYGSLYERRIRLMNQVKEIDQKLAAQTEAVPDQALERAIKQTIESLLACDREYAQIAQKLLAHMRSSMKDLRQGKEVSTRYQTDYALGEGLHFDKRN